MKLQFHRSAPSRTLRQPVPSEVPHMHASTVSALYRAARVGGDFFDFETAGDRLAIVLLDIAGERDEALDIAASLQDEFHQRAPQLFVPGANQAESLNEMLVALNRKIMQVAEGVRCAPGFLASYAEDLGTLFYINAGHVPGLLRSHEGVRLLEAAGPPMGLFSHLTQDAQTCVMAPGDALLLVSKGLIESRAHGQEFGIERLRQSFLTFPFATAADLCSGVLTAVQQYTGHKQSRENDMTTVALLRAAVAAAAPLP